MSCVKVGSTPSENWHPTFCSSPPGTATPYTGSRKGNAHTVNIYIFGCVWYTENTQQPASPAGGIVPAAHLPHIAHPENGASNLRNRSNLEIVYDD